AMMVALLGRCSRRVPLSSSRIFEAPAAPSRTVSVRTRAAGEIAARRSFLFSGASGVGLASPLAFGQTPPALGRTAAHARDELPKNPRYVSRRLLGGDGVAFFGGLPCRLHFLGAVEQVLVDGVLP